MNTSENQKGCSMKNILLTLILISMTSLVHAKGKSFDLKIDLNIDNQHIFSPNLIVKEGEMAYAVNEIGTEKTFIEVQSSEQKFPNGKSGIFMSFIVGKIKADGTKDIISRPEILAYENKKAEIFISKKENTKDLSLSVIAKKAVK